MSAQFDLIAPGFGTRLREERLRLNLNQSEFAEVAGIQRLAQSQYEAESRVPNLRYLAAIAAGGVELYYLLFGKRPTGVALSAAEQREIEKRAFDRIEEYVRTHWAGQLSSEGRFALFEVIRGHMLLAAQNGTEADSDILDAMAPREARNG